MDFGGFDFSDIFNRAQRRCRSRAKSGGGGTGPGAGRRSSGFKDIFSQFFRGGGGEAERRAGTGKRRRSRIRSEYHASGRRSAALRPRSKLPATKSARSVMAPAATTPVPCACPQCNGTGQRQPDGGQHEIQPDLPALQRQRPAEKRLPDLPRRWPHRAYGAGGRAHSARRAERFAAAGGGQR